MHVETYYAIRVGDLRKDKPYYWQDDGDTAVLFATKEEAALACTWFRDVCARVVRVRLRAE